MSSMIVQNMSLKKGQTLMVTGIPNVNCSRFQLNVGHSDTELALHMDCRFNYEIDKNTIVCNSFFEAAWGEEHKDKTFPFTAGKLFMIELTLTGKEFEITLQNGYKFQFPNRLGADKYKYLKFDGEARIQGVEIK